MGCFADGTQLYACNPFVSYTPYMQLIPMFDCNLSWVSDGTSYIMWMKKFVYGGVKGKWRRMRIHPPTLYTHTHSWGMWQVVTVNLRLPPCSKVLALEGCTTTLPYIWQNTFYLHMNVFARYLMLPLREWGPAWWGIHSPHWESSWPRQVQRLQMTSEVKNLMYDYQHVGDYCPRSPQQCELRCI